MKTNPRVSIIIPNWNGMKWLKSSLTDIYKQIYQNIEIIVVDNNSTDGSVEWLEKKHPKVKIIKSKTNLGFGKANNLAVKHCKGSEIFFLNNDTKLKPRLLEDLLRYKQEAKINIVGPRLLNFEGVDTYSGKQISIDPLSTHALSNKTFFVEGCALLISKEDYLKLRGFDSAYFMYSEDIDLCWKAWIFGMKVGICNTTNLTHYGGGSSQKTMQTKREKHTAPLARRYEVEKNNLRNILKNYQVINLIWILPLYSIQFLAETCLYLVTNNLPMIKILIQAISWNLINIKDTLKERGFIQSHRVVNDIAILKKMTPPFNKVRTFFAIGLPTFT